MYTEQHRARLKEWLSDYVFPTWEALISDIDRGKLDDIRSPRAMPKVFLNKGTDLWRHSRVVQKHLQEVPVSDLPEPRQSLVQEFLNSNGKPEASE